MSPLSGLAHLAGQISCSVHMSPPTGIEALRPTSSQPRERVDSTIYCDANELLNTNLFADCCNLFV